MYWLLISIYLIFFSIWLATSKISFVEYIRKRKHFSLPITFMGVILLAIWVRVFVFEIYSIPSGSMEDTLLPGDKVLVSKLNYGPVLPRSPIDIPWFNILFVLSKNDISNIDSLIWSTHRLKGFTAVKHNEIVIFHHPTSKKHNDIFIKRCVGLPYDTLIIKNGTIYINNNELPNPPYSKNKYSVWSNRMLLNEQLNDLGIEFNSNYYQENKIELILNSFQKEQLSKVNLIDSIVRFNIKFDSAQMVYPYSNLLKWSIDNYGSIMIPSKEQNIILNPESVAKYRNVIYSLENKGIYSKNDTVFIEGVESNHFEFSENYYFMMGDNRQYSNDSRYFGPVPEDDVIGKAVLVLFNYHDRKFNLKRIFRLIK